MNFGAILGLSLCAVSVIFLSMGYENNNYQQWISYFLTIATISWGTLFYRNKFNDGYMSYIQALKSCFLITFFSSLILAFFMYIYLNFIDQSMIVKVLEKAEEELMNKNMTDDQIEEAMKITRMMTTPIMMAFFTILVNTFMGGIFALITAAFLKKDNPNNFNQFIQDNQ